MSQYLNVFLEVKGPYFDHQAILEGRILARTQRKNIFLVKSREIMNTSKDEFWSKGQSEYKALCVCGKQQTSSEDPTDYTE